MKASNVTTGRQTLSFASGDGVLDRGCFTDCLVFRVYARTSSKRGRPADFTSYGKYGVGFGLLSVGSGDVLWRSAYDR